MKQGQAAAEQKPPSDGALAGKRKRGDDSGSDGTNERCAKAASLDKASPVPPKAPCAPFLAGRCQKGDACSFSHDRAVIFGDKKDCRIALEDGALGRVIGKGGARIKSIQEKTGVRITNDGKAEVRISGSAAAVEQAAMMVGQFADEKERRIVVKDGVALGRVIGTGGVRIKSIQKKTGAWISNDGVSELRISGSAAAVQEAAAMVQQFASEPKTHGIRRRRDVIDPEISDYLFGGLFGDLFGKYAAEHANQCAREEAEEEEERFMLEDVALYRGGGRMEMKSRAWFKGNGYSDWATRTSEDAYDEQRNEQAHDEYGEY